MQFAFTLFLHYYALHDWLKKILRHFVIQSELSENQNQLQLTHITFLTSHQKQVFYFYEF